MRWIDRPWVTCSRRKRLGLANAHSSDRHEIELVRRREPRQGRFLVRRPKELAEGITCDNEPQHQKRSPAPISRPALRSDSRGCVVGH